MTKATLTIDMPESCMWDEGDVTVVCPVFRVCKPTRGYEFLDTKIDLKAGRLPNCPLQEVKTCKWDWSKGSNGFVECQGSWDGMYRWLRDQFKYCPWCGNEIEVGDSND